MSSFGLTPAGPFPPPTGEGFGTSIQFQDQGVDLGGPDATTLNFSTGLSATRTGDVVTVTGGGGSASGALSLSLSGTVGSSVGMVVIDTWTTDNEFSATTDVTWDGSILSFANTGVYQIEVGTNTAFDLLGTFPLQFGVDVETNQAQQAIRRHDVGQVSIPFSYLNEQSLVDAFYVIVTNTTTTAQIKLYANLYAMPIGSFPPLNAALSVKITRVADEGAASSGIF